MKRIMCWTITLLVLGSLGLGVHHGMTTIPDPTEEPMIKWIKADLLLQGKVTKIETKDGISVAEIALPRQSGTLLDHAVILGDLAIGDTCQIVFVQHANHWNQSLDTKVAVKAK